LSLTTINHQEQTNYRTGSSLPGHASESGGAVPITQPLKPDLSYRVFKFFASLKLAVLLLLSLIIIFSTGTFIESWHGAETARILVYDSFWMAAFLFLLGINVTAAAIDRLPWKQRHIGFVTTHVGIITLLIGSFITQQWMIDGQMAITEGDIEHRITLEEPLIYAFSEKTQSEWLIPINKKPFQWHGQDNLTKQLKNKFPIQLSLISYFPKAKVQEDVVSSSLGPAALEVELKNSFMEQTQTLIQNDARLGSVPIGPARLVFSDTFLSESQGVVTDLGYLEFQFTNDNVRISIEESLQLPKTWSIPGKPYQVTLLRLFKSAAIIGRELTEQSEKGEMKNPAAEFLIEGNGISEKHTVFAKFPDFPTRHGMSPSETGAKIFYRLPNAGSQGETHELRFIKQNDQLFYQVQDGFKITRGTVEMGQSVETGWMDFTFKVNEYYPHSKAQRSFIPQPNTSNSGSVVPAIQIGLEKNGKKQDLWLGQGFREILEFEGDRFHFLYGQKRIPAGFRLQLKDFKIEHYPGTNRPASFESDVILTDDMRGIQEDATISMNEPLIHQGYRIYQSGYQQEPGQPDVSIFSIGKDPGVPVKYAGALIMVSGIIMMFYFKQVSARAGKLKP